MSSPIKLLEEVQSLDLEIKAIDNEEFSVRDAIGALGGEISLLEASIEAERPEIEAINEAELEVSERIRVSNEKISKNEKRIREVSSDKELKALTKENSSANRIAKQGELELKNLESRGEERKSAFAGLEASLEEKRAALTALEEELAGKREGWDSSKAEKVEERNTKAGEVDDEYLRRYEALKNKRGGVVLVNVEDEVCQGCYMNIPPQTYVRLMKGSEEIMTCPHCTRIIYYKEEVS